VDHDDGANLIDGQPLVNEPGSKFDYGVNMDWAGEVLVAVTGRSLGDYFEGERS
jgi:CubicO group peptidase (beta-lactamase class C family)